jgi:cation diffusion facilitator CzcD-associated flavoprotein CzcO
MPRRSRRITGVERAVYRYVPGVQRLLRYALYWGRESFVVGLRHPRVNRIARWIATGHLRRQVSDPDLRAKLTPRYVLGCKRVLLSNDYLPALTRSNVELVTTPIRAVTADAVVTADGARYPVDTIILGTGFHVTDPPLARQIRGRGGRTLAAAWTPTMRAYNGTTVPGFPNLFFLLGPNTGLGHTSVVLMAESQVGHVLAVLDHMRRTGITAIEPTIEARDRYVARVDALMTGTVWTAGGCVSWYLDATGRNSTLWPGFVTGFRRRLRRLRPDHYRPVPVPTSPE